ncbi:MAG: hypothetical protein ACKVXR_08850 [Planctomycetota bacterium]
MGPSRFRTLCVLVFLFLAAVSLRPWRQLDSSFEAAFEPARLLGNLAVPVSWLARSEVRAAEEALISNVEARRADGRAVLLSAQSRAAPREGVLARGRGLVHAEVLERVEDDSDRVRVRFAPGSRVEPGMPVVCGDFYVGRVNSCSAGEAFVDLVTRQDFRVGAVVEGALRGPEVPSAGGDAPLLVVGGVVPRGRPGEGGPRELLLAAHCPSDPDLTAGEVRVREVDPIGGDPYATLADGFLLGSLERAQRDRSSFLAVRPGLDYSGGLYQMAIVCPAENRSAGPDLARDPFDDAAWIDVSLVLQGDPTFWRESRIVRSGRNQELVDGAALELGANYLGCIARAGRSSSSARLLGDAGHEISALASPVDADGNPAGPPIAIGRLTSFGRDRRSGEVFLRWDAAIPLPEADGAAGLPAVLYTAAGQRAVPPGLRVGWTLLPRGRGPFLLRVRQEEDGLGLVHLRAWRDPARPAAPGADAGSTSRP